MIVRKHKPGRTEIPRNPVIDTNILFDFLLWRYSDKIKDLRLLERMQCLRDDSYRKAVAWYLPLAKPIFTSPGVIAEVHGLVTRGMRLRRDDPGIFWTLAREVLSQLELDEKLVKLLEMQPEALANFGPTDTSLLGIAARDGRPVLTEDGKLRRRCLEEQIKVVSVSEIHALLAG